MLFTADAWTSIADVTLDSTYRRWRRRQVVAGGRYRVGGMVVVVDVVDEVAEEDLPLGVVVRGDPSLPVTRIRFHRDADTDPRAALAADTDVDVAEVRARLAGMDGCSPTGPWTLAVLEAIEARPATRAADLAALLGRERDAWKRDVRKLEELGLTLSLEGGYRLSPPGEAYLAGVRRRSGDGAGADPR